MQLSISINTDETQPLLTGTNEAQTLWTARLVGVSCFQWCKKNTFTSQNSTVTLTVVPTFVKKKNSYEQLPESKFCGIHHVHLGKKGSEVIWSQDEVSRIPSEECLKFSLLLKNDASSLACVLIHEQGDTPGEYLYTCPPDFEESKLREIVDRPCENVLERMLLFATSAIVYRELKSLTSLYNYCENTTLLHPTPSIIGEIALLTALQLVDVTDAKLPPQNNTLSLVENPVENLARRLIDKVVAHAESKFRSKHSYQVTVRNLNNSKPIASFYMKLDSALFCPLTLKKDARVLLYSTPHLVKSFIWFLVMFLIYGSRKIIRCDKSFFRPGNKDNFYQPTASRWFVFLAYFSLFLSIASIVVYYVTLRCDAFDGIAQIWIPFILTFFTLVFAHMNIGTIHPKFSIPHFTSIKLAHDKAQLIVLRQTPKNCMNDHTDRDAENREAEPVNFDISWIKQEYMNRSTSTVIVWRIAIGLLFVIAPASQITLFELYHSKEENFPMPCFMNSTVPAALIYSANVITTELTAIVLVICALFYFNAYSMIEGILTKAQENDYHKRNESNEFDVRKPESLEYLLTVIRVMIGSINYSLPHMIMIGGTVLVLFSLTFFVIINYITFHSTTRISIPGCIIYTMILAVPGIIILIKIALINNMVTRNLLEILQDNQQRLINQIVREQSLAMQQRDTTQCSAANPVSKLITARDYLHDQIKLLTGLGDINTVKLLGFLPINLPLLISLGLTAGGSVAAYILSLIK